MELPQELASAIGRALEGEKAMREAAGRLSSRYRAAEPGRAGYIAGSLDAAAYAATRMPATYAAAFAALRMAAAALPGFRPRALLDAGAGTGAAAWAALSLWPELEAVTLIERDESMAALGRTLAADAPAPALREGLWVRADLAGGWRAGPFDLAVLCYALGELPADRQAAAVGRLWDAADTLVLVEPGTTEGWGRIARARNALLAAGAGIAAPCPGNVPCPEAGGWCHFSVRVARSRLHRSAKGALLPYEDEKFSCLVATKGERSPCGARVLRHPRIHKGHVELELCTAEGLRPLTVSRRGGEAYREARRLVWGDEVPERIVRG